MRLIFGLLLITFLSCSHHGKHHKGHGHHHRFDDADKWEKVFENKKRDAWQKPDQVLKALGIKKNSVVADIGAATGYFPVRIAKIATKGRVWGIDIEPNMVNFLNRRARKENLKNLFSTLGTFDDPLIPEPADFILMVDTYHHINKREQYFSNLKLSLKKNGRLVIIDFKKGELPMGPPDKMKLSAEEVVNELKVAGYELDKSHGLLDYQYVLVFK